MVLSREAGWVCFLPFAWLPALVSLLRDKGSKPVSWPFWYFVCFPVISQSRPKGGRVLLMSPACLESQGCHLTPSFYLLPCYSAMSCCSFCLLLVSAFGPVPCLLSRNVLTLFFFLEIRFFVLPLCFFNGWEIISLSVLSVACYLLALVLAIYTLRHVSFLISWWCLLMIFFYMFW